MNAETEIVQLKERLTSLENRLAALETGQVNPKPRTYSEHGVATIRSAPAPHFEQRKLRSNQAAPTVIRSEPEPRIVHQTEEGEIEI
jgi:hypothetical protein